MLNTRGLDGEAQKLGAQLPQGFREYLQTPEDKPEEFHADEFLIRVQNRRGGTQREAKTATHAVLPSITEAVTVGEHVSFMNALPNELSDDARWT